MSKKLTLELTQEQCFYLYECVESVHTQQHEYERDHKKTITDVINPFLSINRRNIIKSHRVRSLLIEAMDV